MDNVNELMAERDYPVLATKGLVVFPHNEVNIEAGRVFSKRAIRVSGEQFSNLIIVIPQLNPRNDEVALDKLSPIGTVAKIKTVRRYENGVVKAVVMGLYRVKIESLYQEEGVFYSKCSMISLQKLRQPI